MQQPARDLSKLIQMCHEDFWSSVILLAFLSSNLFPAALEQLSDLVIWTSKGQKRLGEELPFDTPIRGCVGASITARDKSEIRWNQLRPDVYLTTRRGVLLIENKKGSSRTPGQKDAAYEMYLVNRHSDLKCVICYILPVSRWNPADSRNEKNEWAQWLMTPDEKIARCIMLWDQKSTSSILEAARITSLVNFLELPR